MNEKEFQSNVTELCKWRRLNWYHTHDSRRSPSGFPDLVIVGPGGCIFAELKSEKGKVTPTQQTWIDSLNNAGQRAEVWRPSDWPYIVDTLAELSRRVLTQN